MHLDLVATPRGRVGGRSVVVTERSRRASGRRSRCAVTELSGIRTDAAQPFR
jgi:hypothetical protein